MTKLTWNKHLYLPAPGYYVEKPHIWRSKEDRIWKCATVHRWRAGKPDEYWTIYDLCVGYTAKEAYDLYHSRKMIQAGQRPKASEGN